MSNTPSFVTQVSKDATHLQLDQAVRQRRESVSATRARRESMSKAKEETQEVDPVEVKVCQSVSLVLTYRPVLCWSKSVPVVAPSLYMSKSRRHPIVTITSCLLCQQVDVFLTQSTARSVWCWTWTKHSYTAPLNR